MNPLPQRAKVALAREEKRRDYFLQLRCQCRLSNAEYRYCDECAARLFTCPGADGLLPSVPCGLVGELRLGKQNGA